jgi:hypothetical protein
MTADEFDANVFIRNRNAWPTEKFLLYAGKHVAWSGDGTTILAAADTAEELFEVMDATFPPDEFYVLGYLPPGPYVDQRVVANPPGGYPFGPPANGTNP